MLTEEKSRPAASKSTFIDPFHYARRKTRVVMVGNVGVGGDNPLRLQSMTTTPTDDTQKTVEQVLRLADVGCEIARITAPTNLDAQNLENIKSELIKRNCLIPLVADIHFRPDAAMIAADFVEKVRVNPGNYVDGKAFKVREYTDDQYKSELNRIEDKFTPLVLKLKKLKRALRIGTNHGSLSDRIMNRFGDTPLGMVESAMEYLYVCRKNDFHDVIFSMKASNPRVMITAYRLLAERLAKEQMDYPFHVGVTEAGFGADGRIKSAAGIGSLLEDGIGDTIRVSLTEDPEFEIPVARELADRYVNGLRRGEAVPRPGDSSIRATQRVAPTFSRRHVIPVNIGPISIGVDQPIRIVSHIDLAAQSAADVIAMLEARLKKDTPPEILEIPFSTETTFNDKLMQFRHALAQETSRLGLAVAIDQSNWSAANVTGADAYIYYIGTTLSIDDQAAIRDLRAQGRTLLLALRGDAAGSVHGVRRLVADLTQNEIHLPLLLTSMSAKPELSTAVIQGSLICDGIGDAVSVATGPLSVGELDFAYNLLQACGNRLTKTEFVSCPSCGRTLFDLQTTTERIKSKTGHLKGVKIAIMGCIVNGPGEMADADFGYVGGGPGKINLYVGKTCVEKSIPMDSADEKLIHLIKSHGKWVDPT